LGAFAFRAYSRVTIGAGTGLAAGTGVAAATAKEEAVIPAEKTLSFTTTAAATAK
jgi:hypothetical protein